MKKHLWTIAALLMGASLFTACNDDDDPKKNLQGFEVIDGMLTVCSGNERVGIPGSLTLFDYEKEAATQNVFAKTNGMSLGSTANDALVYGTKLYVTVTNENTLWVLDSKTFKAIKRIDTKELVGNDTGLKPRRLCSYEGKVYVSTFGGVVAAIDTIAYERKNLYQAGSYPEGIIVHNGFLYVANSDYGNGKNPSISKINLKTNTATAIVGKDVINPQYFAVSGNELFFLDYGGYDAEYNQHDNGIRRLNDDDTMNRIVDATAMTANDRFVYSYNNPYPTTKIAYNKYDTRNRSVTALALQNIDSPAAIGIDLVKGWLYVASLKKNPETGYADYKAAGYVNIYDAAGNLHKTYDTGVGPTTFAFRTKLLFK